MGWDCVGARRSLALTINWRRLTLPVIPSLKGEESACDKRFSHGQLEMTPG